MRALPADAESLELYGQPVGADGAAVLAQLLPGWPALKRRGLGRTQLGDAGATILAQALRVNHTIVQLALHDNGISAVGITALAAALRDNMSIRQLGLNDNPLGNDGAVQFFQTLGASPTSALVSLHYRTAELGAS